MSPSALVAWRMREGPPVRQRLRRVTPRQKLLDRVPAAQSAQEAVKVGLSQFQEAQLEDQARAA
ncbi:MAG: hypothetical protein ACYDGW_05800 [Vulcanimicrobiaceae bacterium]